MPKWYGLQGLIIIIIIINSLGTRTVGVNTKCRSKLQMLPASPQITCAAGAENTNSLPVCSLRSSNIRQN
jgi:hypothetical protein